MVRPLASCFTWRLGWILVLVVGMARPSSAGFTIQDLGVLTPFGTSSGSAINALGQVAGSANNLSGNLVAVSTVQSGQVQAVGLPPDAIQSRGNAINLSGSVAGSYLDKFNAQHAFVSGPDGVSVVTPLAGGTYTVANGINGSGMVIGTGDVLDGTTRAFVMGIGGHPTAITPLGTGTFNVGNGINDSGSAVGTSQIAPGGLVHAFLAVPGLSTVDLLSRNAAGDFSYNTYGTAIANTGDVAGYGDVGRYEHAFFAPSGGGTLVDLGVLPGGSSSYGYGLNDLSQVVGSVNYGITQPGQPNSEAFIWDAVYGMFNLNTLISTTDQASWVLTQATGINDSAEITGTGLLNGVAHAFLLTPIPDEPLFSTPGQTVPEPPAVGLTLIGLLTVIIGANRLKPGRTEGQAIA